MAKAKKKRSLRPVNTPHPVNEALHNILHLISMEAAYTDFEDVSSFLPIQGQAYLYRDKLFILSNSPDELPVHEWLPKFDQRAKLFARIEMHEFSSYVTIITGYKPR